MHVVTRWKVVTRNARKGMGAVAVCGMMATPFACAATSAAQAYVPDTHMMADLEQRAMMANPREQTLLYADLADKMTLLASRQIADGEIENAEATLQKLELCTAKMESNLQQSKSLKKTELLLHTTNRRLTDMARAASSEVKPHVQTALQRLNAAQASLLVAIFAK